MCQWPGCLLQCHSEWHDLVVGIEHPCVVGVVSTVVVGRRIDFVHLETFGAVEANDLVGSAIDGGWLAHVVVRAVVLWPIQVCLVVMDLVEVQWPSATFELPALAGQCDLQQLPGVKQHHLSQMKKP